MMVQKTTQRYLLQVCVENELIQRREEEFSLGAEVDTGAILALLLLLLCTCRYAIPGGH